MCSNSWFEIRRPNDSNMQGLKKRDTALYTAAAGLMVDVTHALYQGMYCRSCHSGTSTGSMLIRQADTWRPGGHSERRELEPKAGRQGQSRTLPLTKQRHLKHVSHGRHDNIELACRLASCDLLYPAWHWYSVLQRACGIKSFPGNQLHIIYCWYDVWYLARNALCDDSQENFSIC